jgi:hypothetical protein
MLHHCSPAPTLSYLGFCLQQTRLIDNQQFVNFDLVVHDRTWWGSTSWQLMVRCMLEWRCYADSSQCSSAALRPIWCADPSLFTSSDIIISRILPPTNKTVWQPTSGDNQVCSGLKPCMVYTSLHTNGITNHLPRSRRQWWSNSQLGWWKSVPTSLVYQGSSTKSNNRVLQLIADPTLFTSSDIVLSRVLPPTKANRQRSSRPQGLLTFQHKCSTRYCYKVENLVVSAAGAVPFPGLIALQCCCCSSICSTVLLLPKSRLHSSLHLE